ncbi:NAD(P)H nitroreductase [Pseudoalteromonas sp. MM17-2]|uniref:NAD(P)H nitroreductase n=1 Tax=Pseudoalteromonas sp. MM17-2 TaxID=2917753 RepID=UPI001EF5837C|nr:NAD(P)H nitroreductase [Pseudoalteromonas sp. MM17-2]MCG7542667.1 NAD(P)H nitroreductase [Pseudoalteromonas sp. MM17-2]
MNAKELLLNRQSDSQLSFPGPNAQQLELIQQAALRVPDHGHLAPWKFVVLQERQREKLGDIFLQAAQKEDMGERVIERAASLPARAPMVIVCIMKYIGHDKVPWVEQVASASCATFAMQQAAFAQGLSGIWRTGAFAKSATVKQALKLTDDDEIVGFLYLGTPTVDCPKKRRHQVADFFTDSL